MIISTLKTGGPEETRALGSCLGKLLLPGDTLALAGELGSGKTVLAQGILSARLGKGHYPSPTFTLVNAYPGGLYHLDLYRLTDPAQIEDLGYEEIFSPETIAVVEWGERSSAYLPPDRLEIGLSGAGSERELTFRPGGPRSTRLLQALLALWEEGTC